MKSSSLLLVAMLALAPLAAFAEDSGGSLPDGPVASPPGWDCTASDGVVTCVPEQDDSIEQD